jgi:hypothetical protein
MFSRWPLGPDETILKPHLDRLGCASHSLFGLPYDAAVLLAPIPPQAYEAGDVRAAYVDSAEDYVSALTRHLASAKEKPRSGLIISGAFPEAAPRHEQHLTDAIHALVRAAFDHGLFIIFGNHPTFRPLIVEVARRRATEDPRKLVRMYTSEYFVAPAEQELLRQDADVVLTPTIAGDRGQSLTEMRRAMIRDKDALALIAIGGRGLRPGVVPGIDEEIAMARDAKTPVFLLGAAGGRTAQVASELSQAGWDPPINPLPALDNERLRTSLDFDELADLILASLGR